MKINLSSNLKSYLGEKVFSFLKEISDFASDNNFHPYLVGGSIRDLLSGQETDLDLDLVIEPNAIDLVNLIIKEKNLYGVTFEKYGTGKIKTDLVQVDFATARTETYSHPAAHPLVSFSNIKDDLIRRDFTINALAIRLDKENFGDLIDIFDGYNDLKNKRIKILHDKSFIDDPNRIFRAVRFEDKLGFKIDSHTFNLAEKTMSSGIFDYFINDRIKTELRVGLSYPYNSIKNIGRLFDTKAIRCINPEIEKDETIKELKILKENIDYYEQTTNSKVENWLLYLCYLIAKIPSHEKFEEIQNHIHFTASEVHLSNSVKSLITHSFDKNIHRVQLYDLFRRYDEIALLALISQEKNFYLKDYVFEFITKLKACRPHLNGKDLGSLGLKGKEIGFILRALLEEIIEGNIKTKEDELIYVSKYTSN